VNFGLRGVTKAASRGDLSGLRALDRLTGQSELGAPYGGICVLLADALASSSPALQTPRYSGAYSLARLNSETDVNDQKLLVLGTALQNTTTSQRVLRISDFVTYYTICR